MKARYFLGAAFVLGTLSLCTSCENYFDEKYMDNGDPQKSVVPGRSMKRRSPSNNMKTIRTEQ